LGFEVIGIEFGGRVAIQGHGKRSDGERFAPTFKLCFGEAFAYIDEDRTRHDLNAENPWSSLTGLFALRHKVIASATADNRSNLEVRFEDGSGLDAGPDEDYENWELVGPGNLNLVGLPGGGDPRISGSLGE
jgi:hypothetical protein